MKFNHDWRPSHDDHDGSTRIWLRRVALVVVLLIVILAAASVRSYIARGDDGPSRPQMASSTSRPQTPFVETAKWNDEVITRTYAMVADGWVTASKAKQADLCALMKTGYQERAARSLPHGDADDAYKRSFGLPADFMDWYLAAELLEAKCTYGS